MRALAAVLAVAAALALSGCMSEHSPVDPETTERDDYAVPLLVLGVAILVGVILLAINLTSQPSQPGGNPPPPAPQPPATPAETTWQVEDEDAEAPAAAPAPRKAARSAPKTTRRRAP